MKLIIGGYAQGKREYACDTFSCMESEVADGEYATFEELVQAKVVDHYHLYIKQVLNRKGNIKEETKRLLEENPDVILIADEFGCGLVPMDPFERIYRDEAGHLLCEVAKRAKEVHRVFCGIGSVIKHG